MIVNENSDCSTPILTTDRLILRQFSPGDASRIHQLVNDKEVAYTTHYIPYPYPAGAAEEWLKEHERLVRIGQAVVFGVCIASKSPSASRLNVESKAVNQTRPLLIGTVGLAIDDLDHRAELGYWLGREYWGRGYGTEAVAAAIDYGFDELGLHRIFATHIRRNVASARLLKKVGFEREGVLRQHARKWGVFEDVICYGMLATDRRPRSMIRR
jgi:RimJ/RimL family protein N-acetyltransferase